MKVSKYIFPVLFTVFVLIVAGDLAVNACRELGIRGTVSEMAAGLINADPDGWESRVNEDIDREHRFINYFGALQRAMGKRLVEDAAGNPVAKLSTGQLTFASLTENVPQTGNADNMVRLRKTLDGSGIPLALVIAPTKLSNPAAAMPEGAPDYGNAMGDALIRELGDQVYTIDLRPSFVAADPDNRWFFRTDHHWRAEGALYACGTLMEALRGEYGFDVDETALDPASYSSVTYPELFLGSQGKRVGLYYAGTDDFTALTPKFETRFEYTYTDLPEPRVGPFEDALCFSQWLNRDYFGGNPYLYYSGGDWGRSEIKNLLKPDGPTVVLIRDSFSCALAPFLALQCGRLITVDLRAYEGDLSRELLDIRPDAVLVLYSASSVKDGAMFDFFGENK